MGKLSLADFRSHVTDFARPNRFEVDITAPIISDYDPVEREMLVWLAESATIPSRGQGEAKMKFHGMELSLPGDYAKENLTIGFLNSYGWEGRRFFERWIEKIQRISSVNDRASAGDLLKDSFIVVTQKGRTEVDVVAQYKYWNTYPTNISAIDLSMGETDQIEKFTVTFAYTHAEPISGNII